MDAGEESKIPVGLELKRRQTLQQRLDLEEKQRLQLVESHRDLVSDTKTSKSIEPTFGDIFISGATAGMVGRTCTAPLDRLKILLQAGKSKDLPRWPKGTKGAPGSFIRSPLSLVFRHVLRDGGILGFWRGNGANVLKVMPETAVKFVIYEFIKSTWLGESPDTEKLSIAQRFFCGSVAGGISQLAIYPLDFTKTRLAASLQGTYTGILDCIGKTIKYEGPTALYKGILPALGSIVPAVGIELAMYNTLKEKYKKKELERRNNYKWGVDPKSDELEEYLLKRPLTVPIATSLMFGAVSAISGAVIAYPLALTRTKLITQGMPGRPIFYKGAVDCITQTLKHQGIIGLYRGQLPSLLKTVPAITIGYGVFECTKQFLNDRRLGMNLREIEL